MRETGVHALLLLAGSSGVVDAAEYWPLRPGLRFECQAPDGAQLTVTYAESTPGVITRGGTTESGGERCIFTQDYAAGGVEDVLLLRGTHFCDGYIDPDLLESDPPLPVLDLPLTLGKTWVWQGDFSGWGPSAGWLFASVVGAMTVTVPAGTFDVVHVQLTAVGANFPPGRELYLHTALGPVKVDDWELVSWDGIVPVGSGSWGQLKSSFR